jgi:hypothetical protein
LGGWGGHRRGSAATTRRSHVRRGACETDGVVRWEGRGRKQARRKKAQGKGVATQRESPRKPTEAPKPPQRNGNANKPILPGAPRSPPPRGRPHDARHYHNMAQTSARTRDAGDTPQDAAPLVCATNNRKKEKKRVQPTAHLGLRCPCVRPLWTATTPRTTPTPCPTTGRTPAGPCHTRWALHRPSLGSGSEASARSHPPPQSPWRSRTAAGSGRAGCLPRAHRFPHYRTARSCHPA